MTPDERVFKDPRFFREEDFPVIVLCNNQQGFLGWVIKAHSADNWCHAMIMRRPGMVVTQTNVLKEIPIQTYMVKAMMMKFWRVKDLTPTEKLLLCACINTDLKKPWWFRSYDYVGLLGQAVWLRWLQIPWLKYCSESIAVWFRKLPRFTKIIPPEPSPSDLDNVFEFNKDTMVCMGYWWEN